MEFEQARHMPLQELTRLISSIDAAAIFKEPLDALTAYRLLVHQIRSSRLQHLIVPKFEELHELQSRKAFQAHLMRRWHEITPAQVFKVRQELVALFGPDGPSVPIAQASLDKLARALATVGHPVSLVFSDKAMCWANAEHNSNIWLFTAANFPGPDPGTGSWPYTWLHATDTRGLLGVLAVGKILRSATDQVGLNPSKGEYSFSFFARGCDKKPRGADWQHWIAGARHSPKNVDDILLMGCMDTQHHRAPSADTCHENNLTRMTPLIRSPAGRWAVREAAARIDFIAVASSSRDSNFKGDEPRAPAIAADTWGRWGPSGHLDPVRQLRSQV